MIETLQDLRLLPPPFNELVPLLTTIAVFSAASLGFDLEEVWPKVTNEIMSSFLWTEQNLAVYGTFALHMATYWGYSLFIHIAEQSFPKTLSNFKIQKECPVASWMEVSKIVPLVLFNQCIFCLPVLTALFSLRPIDMTVPSIPKFVGFCLVQILCTEVCRTLYTGHYTPNLLQTHPLHPSPIQGALLSGNRLCPPIRVCDPPIWCPLGGPSRDGSTLVGCVCVDRAKYVSGSSRSLRLLVSLSTPRPFA